MKTKTSSVARFGVPALIVLLGFSFNSWASNGSRREVQEVRIMCIEGYKFAVAISPNGYGVSLIQIFNPNTQNRTGHPQPATCRT